MKKNILMGLVCPAMALAAVATPVLAASPVSGAQETTPVKYEVAGTDWTFSVPATQTFDDDHLEYLNQLVAIKPAAKGTVIALANNTTISIKLTSQYGFNLVAEGINTNSKIPYAVKMNGTKLEGETEVLKFVAGTSANTGIEQGLDFSTTNDANGIKKATVVGTHKDTLTFTATVTP